MTTFPRPTATATRVVEPSAFPGRSLGDLLATAQRRGDSSGAPLEPSGRTLGATASAARAGEGAAENDAPSPGWSLPLRNGSAGMIDDSSDELAERIQCILQEQARRHGIDL